MATHPFIELQNQFEKGAALRPADPADIKEFWLAQRKWEAEFGPPKRDVVATGLGALGIDVSKRGPDFETELFFITTRLGMLCNLVARGVLKDYQEGEELDERVYRAAATVSFTYEEWGESMMAERLPQYHADVVANVKQQFRDHGYDLDHPRIDTKFLAWLREHC